MPRKISKLITCPNCGKQNAEQIIESANSIDDKNIRSVIFDETLFIKKCPECGFSVKCQHPFLYNDLQNRFMVYFIPRVERSKLSDPKLDAEYSDITGVKKRLVSTINAMKEKIYLLENGINDMAVELTKLAVSEVVAKDTGHYIYEGYFTDMDEEKNSISFQFFVGPERRSYIQTTRLEIYSQSVDIVNNYFKNFDKQPSFLNIDKNWAKNALEKYKSFGS